MPGAEDHPSRKGAAAAPFSAVANVSNTSNVSIGTILGSKYRVDAVLGSGGMGIVLAATHLQLRERFAVKLLHPEASLRADAVGRFLREARVAMKLRGEHVVRIYDVGTLDDGSPFIAMECLEGRDLRAVLLDDGRLDPVVAVDYLLQASEAIAEAHSLAVIHRDLKPANLFLTQRADGSPSVKVLDFGVSKIGGALAVREDPFAVTSSAPDSSAVPNVPSPELAETMQASGMTRTRALLGSPRYMAPEQLRSPRDVDARADVWALGAILFELVSGEPPFEGDTLDELRRAVTSAPAPPLREIAPQLEWVIHRCLAKDPRQRFATVSELAEALAPFASEEGARCIERIERIARGAVSGALAGTQSSAPAAGGLTEDAVVRAETRRPPRVGWLTWTAAAIGLLVAGASVVVPRGGQRSAPESPREREPVNAAPTRPVAPEAPAGTQGEGARTPASAAVPVTSSVPTGEAPSPFRGRPPVRASTPPPRVPDPAPATAPEPHPAPFDPLRIDAGPLFDERK